MEVLGYTWLDRQPRWLRLTVYLLYPVLVVAQIVLIVVILLSESIYHFCKGKGG